jgi:hypothetical protein
MHEEAGLRRALEITEKMIEVRCEKYPRTQSWEEGWRLGTKSPTSSRGSCRATTQETAKAWDKEDWTFYEAWTQR